MRIGLAVLTGCLLAVSGWAHSPGAVLDDWHRAAAEADEARYFAYFAPDGVFMGTDATERWTAAEFHEWAKARFASKKTWNFHPRDRQLTFLVGGRVAWFDEMLDTPNLGVCRGSGVLVKLSDQWKIAQYNLSIAIPNALANEFVAKIRASAPPPRLQR